ncbi:hypothetical protein C0995_011841 [Termitomyces sp. Mi166|nr:hypothetical protein C0995_011841 [Termitomyces sp. Mi166\
MADPVAVRTVTGTPLLLDGLFAFTAVDVEVVDKLDTAKEVVRGSDEVGDTTELVVGVEHTDTEEADVGGTRLEETDDTVEPMDVGKETDNVLGLSETILVEAKGNATVEDRFKETVLVVP